MKKYDVIVIGGGISGLSFAHHASRAKKKVLILEKEKEVGGSFATTQREADDFWIELSAHTCYNSYRSLIEVMEQCKIINDITARAKAPFKLYTKNGIKSFTSQINFFELLTSVPRLFGSKKDGQTVKSYYGNIVGRKNFEKVFSALFSAVPSQNADDFPANALFKKRERRKDIIKHYTMKMGLQSICQAIVDANDFDLECESVLHSLEKRESRFIVKTNSDTFETENLAICTSLPAAQKITESVAPEISALLSKLIFQSIESVGIVVKKDDVSLKPFAGLVPTDDQFYSAVSRDVIPHNELRGFTFHFKPDSLTLEQKIGKICEVLGIEESQILEHHEKLNIVPSLRLGHYELMDGVDQKLMGSQVYISGNYFAGLSIEDCVSRSKAEVDRMLQA